MNGFPNTTFYKVISLFIKSIILFFSFYYIYDKLRDAPAMLELSTLFSAENYVYTLLILFLMLVNWGIEGLKWKKLIAPLEAISFLSSLKAVFAGVTLSIFTPNRVGEFVGRVFFLKQADKVKASLMSLIGSIMQLIVTIIAGVLAYFILEKKYYDFFQTEQFISTDALLGLVVSVVLMIVVLVVLIRKKETTFLRFKKYIEVVKLYSKKELNTIFNLSLLRYVVFAIQYYLALRIFGINGGVVILFSLIALTFFVTSAIPTFALTEIAVRAGVAIYFFGTISTTHAAIVAASLFLWIINLAFPALIGSIYVLKFKMIKE